MSSGIDVLIRGAKVVDGSGNPWFYGDVAISGERIAHIAPPGSIPDSAAAEVVQAEGMVVCPGFIDIQSHSIVPLMVDGRCLSKITQGVTTEIMGEAWTPAPVGGRNMDDLRHTPYAPLEEWRELATGWTRFGYWLEAMVKEGVHQLQLIQIWLTSRHDCRVQAAVGGPTHVPTVPDIIHP